MITLDKRSACFFCHLSRCALQTW